MHRKNSLDQSLLLGTFAPSLVALGVTARDDGIPGNAGIASARVRVASGPGMVAPQVFRAHLRVDLGLPTDVHSQAK